MEALKKKALGLVKFIITSCLYSNERVEVNRSILNAERETSKPLDVLLRETDMFHIIKKTEEPVCILSAVILVAIDNGVNECCEVKLMDKSKEVDILDIPYEWSIRFIQTDETRMYRVCVHVGADKKVAFWCIETESFILRFIKGTLQMFCLKNISKPLFSYGPNTQTVDKDHLKMMIAHINDVETLHTDTLYANRLDKVIKEYAEFSGSPEIHALNLEVDPDFNKV